MGRSCCETQHLVGRMLDHIVLVTSNFRQDAEWLADRTGISGTYGGHNPVNGTHNMLFPLSAGAYLELLAADEQRPATAERALAVLGLRGDLAVAGSDLCGFNLTVRGPDGIVALRGDNGRPEGLVGDRSGSQTAAKAGEETEGEDE